MNYIMPVRAIKNILRKELEDHKQGFYNAYPAFIMSDVQKEIINISYEVLINKLASCTSYDELDNFISFAGYRMSLQEWVESL